MSQTESNSVVQCPKCKQMVSALDDNCQACNAHLYVVCRECGSKNLRTEKTCKKCGTNFHRQKKKNREEKVNIGDNLTTILVPIVVIALLGVVYLLAKRLLWVYNLLETRRLGMNIVHTAFVDPILNIFQVWHVEFLFFFICLLSDSEQYREVGWGHN